MMKIYTQKAFIIATSGYIASADTIINRKYITK